jgi:hypothetical protein
MEQIKIAPNFSYFDLYKALNSVNISEVQCHCVDAENLIKLDFTRRGSGIGAAAYLINMVSGFSVQVSGINRLLVAGSSLLACSQ